MKLTYPPLLAFHEVGFLQHMLFGSILICVAVKGLYFHQDLEQKNKNKKVMGKVLKLCFSVRPNAEKATFDDGRIAYFMNGLKNVKRCFTVVIL